MKRIIVLSNVQGSPMGRLVHRPPGGVAVNTVRLIEGFVFYLNLHTANLIRQRLAASDR